MARPNPLGTVQSSNKQRFYFDTRGGTEHANHPFHMPISPSLLSGVLLPGEVLNFPFLFKSRNAGIFRERWLLATSPLLNQGKPIIITLKGVAWQDDIYRERRDEIEVKKKKNP